MKQILITGGTTFVSKYTAMYFVQAGYDVFVLNRNTKPQVAGVHLIEGDRHQLGKLLQGYAFDAIVDVTAYNDTDVDDLLDALDTFGQYILISSSAVYPETGLQPFDEKLPRGYNKYWGAYGLGKIAAEDAAMQRTKDAYILRPPYLYGPMNNVYREAFVFDCARDNRTFYLPRDGEMKLQFFHVRDLCRCVEAIICNAPSEHIYNVGNQDVISIKDWVTLCYAALDKMPAFRNVYAPIDQRSYFSFYDYEYQLNTDRQKSLIVDTIPLQDGLREAAAWYLVHEEECKKKPFFEFIDTHFPAM